MVQYVSGLDRSQPMLLPASVDDYVSPESPVRVVDAFVDSLDLVDLGFKTRTSDSLGRSGFDPATLIQNLPLGLSQPHKIQPLPQARLRLGPHPHLAHRKSPP